MEAVAGRAAGGARQWRESVGAMHSFVRAVTLAALLALAAAAARRTDQDFEFDDDADGGAAEAGVGHARRPRRYVYDPHNSLCRSLVCKKREVCLLRDAFTALCATKKDILRRGDIIVAASSGSGAVWEREPETRGSEWERDGDDDDVFYDASARDDADTDLDADDAKRCVGCGPATGGGGGAAGASFLCGSDNRTYSSLCRLDLHNCVRRGARPVRLACRGFCPCRRPRRRPRPHRQDAHNDWRRRKMESSHNEVLPERQSRRRFTQGSEGCALDKMANRLLDWFSVLMEEAASTAPPADGTDALNYVTNCCLVTISEQLNRVAFCLRRFPERLQAGGALDVRAPRHGRRRAAVRRQPVLAA
ncbi:unnamed protein product [Chrysodeixis includens]|uniref:Kazal-like domain-containing protein n=1 Tax=Chrysodeixis includens TaxID=689277 RepID=A0A9P0BZT4_CHRIL|nr:unnamed protein product [Chrysodeixis includens]